jgi:hypothetical protein
MESPRSALIGFLFSIVILCIFVFACQPERKATERIEQTSVSSLCRYFKDFPDAESVWCGRKVQIVLEGLPKETYRVVGSELHCFTGLPNSEPIMVFECGVALADNKRTVEVIGRVERCKRDGRNRGAGFTFCIVICDCSVVTK